MTNYEFAAMAWIQAQNSEANEYRVNFNYDVSPNSYDRVIWIMRDDENVTPAQSELDQFAEDGDALKAQVASPPVAKAPEERIAELEALVASLLEA